MNSKLGTIERRFELNPIQDLQSRQKDGAGKSFVFSIIIIGMFIINLCRDEDVEKVYIKSVQCNTSAQYVFPNISCYPKSYSRTLSTVNIVWTFKAPVAKLFVCKELSVLFESSAYKFLKVESKLQYKYGVIYREVMHTQKLNWCQLMKEDELENKMFAQLIHLLKDSTPTVIHECPYNVILTEVNRIVCEDVVISGNRHKKCKR